MYTIFTFIENTLTYQVQREPGSETEQQRAARLLQLRQSQQQRISSETEEQREARLLQLRQSNHLRISSETEEQRATRLLQLRQSQQRRRTLSGTQQQSLADITLSHAHDQETALLDQPAVTSKVLNFHVQLAGLEASCCGICHESLPVLAVSSSQECRRCSSDHSSPRLYSIDNNMVPGTVPSELQVS